CFGRWAFSKNQYYSNLLMLFDIIQTAPEIIINLILRIRTYRPPKLGRTAAAGGPALVGVIPKHRSEFFITPPVNPRDKIQRASHKKRLQDNPIPAIFPQKVGGMGIAKRYGIKDGTYIAPDPLGCPFFECPRIRQHRKHLIQRNPLTHITGYKGLVKKAQKGFLLPFRNAKNQI